MIARCRGPRSELRGATDILDIKNDKLVFRRPDCLKLVEIFKWAKTVRPHESVLRELEANIEGLRASARFEWLDAVESLARLGSVQGARESSYRQVMS